MAEPVDRGHRGRPAVKALALAVFMLFAVPLATAAEDLSAFDWQQHPGAKLPLDALVRDAGGQTLPLGHVFHGVPMILDLGYFNCPALCGIVRANLFDALDASGLRAGRDYELVSLSIDAKEQPADAATAKARDLAAWPGGGRGADLHYLVGTQDVVDAVTGAVGFRARYDGRFKQFLHPTGIVLLTGSGTVSSYLLGLHYAAGDLRSGLIRARSGGIARAALPVLLLCFHYDAGTGRYTLAIMKLLRLMAGLTAATVAGLFVVLSRSRPRGVG